MSSSSASSASISSASAVQAVSDFAWVDEKWMIDKVKEYADLRAKVLEPAEKFAPFFESSAMFQLVLWTGTIGLIVILYAQIRDITLFSLHPVCMLIGCFIFMAQGIVSFRNNAVMSSFAPIMSGSKRLKRFAIHRTLQTLALSFIVLGLILILTNKMRNNSTVLPHTFHSVFGLASLLLVVFQVVVGVRKLETLMASKVKTFRFHGGLGLLNWDLICASVLLGFMEFLSLSDLLSYLVAMLLALAVWFAVHAQVRHQARFDADSDKNESVGLLTREGGEEEAATIGSAGSMRDILYSRDVDSNPHSNFRSATNSPENSDGENEATPLKDTV